MGTEAIYRPVFIAKNAPTVLGRTYAIYPSASGNWMQRHGQGINVMNLSPHISNEFKVDIAKNAICFKKHTRNGDIVYTVMMNDDIRNMLWKIMDCPAFCARIRQGYVQYVEKKRAKRKMIIGILLRKKFDIFFIRMFVRDFLL